MISCLLILFLNFGAAWAQDETPPSPTPEPVFFDPEMSETTRANLPPAYRKKLIDKRTGRDPFFLGHLLTPTVSTLNEGQWTAGTMALGYGISNELMVATSPWLIGFYNMTNLEVRWRSKELDPTWGLQGGYFKTDPSLGKVYKMEAGALWALYRRRVSPNYRVVFSFNSFYFMNDDAPFSLRRWSLGDRNSEKLQLTFTTLHELGTGGPFRFYMEAGILGFNYKYPNYHFGASGGYRWTSGYVQFGLSATGYLNYMTRSAYNQVYNDYQGTPGAQVSFNSVYRNSVAVHPEVQVQFLF